MGALWEERFKCVLVEGRGGTTTDGLGGLLAVAAYIDLNPVRAGLVEDPKDYRWCSYAAATAGDMAARAGLARCAGERKSAPWRRVARAYRLTLFGAGEDGAGGASVDGTVVRRRGFTQAQIDKVLKGGGALPLPVLLRCRLRYFTEGAALGGRRFLDAYLDCRESDGGAGGRQRAATRVGGPGGLDLMAASWSKRDAIAAPG